MREQRGLPLLDTLRQDLLSTPFACCGGIPASRQPPSSPSHLASAPTARSSASSNAILLRPLPLAEPSQLVMIFATEARRSLQFDGVSYPAFIDWQEQNRSFESMAAFANRDLPLGTGDEVVVARGKVVSANLFDVVGVQPAIGRAFRDWRLGSSDVVILSDGFWKRHFGGSPVSHRSDGANRRTSAHDRRGDATAFYARRRFRGLLPAAGGRNANRGPRFPPDRWVGSAAASRSSKRATTCRRSRGGSNGCTPARTTGSAPTWCRWPTPSREGSGWAC